MICKAELTVRRQPFFHVFSLYELSNKDLRCICCVLLILCVARGPTSLGLGIMRRSSSCGETMAAASVVFVWRHRWVLLVVFVCVARRASVEGHFFPFQRRVVFFPRSQRSLFETPQSQTFDERSEVVMPNTEVRGARVCH